MVKLTQAMVKRSIADWVNANGGLGTVINVSGIPIKGNPKVFRKNTDMRGMEDVLICWRSKFIGVEVKKTKGEVLSKDQLDRQAAIERAGGIYLVVRDFADFLNQWIGSDLIRD